MAALSFCETVSATSVSPWHLRERADGDPLKPGGGLFVQALCGRDLNGGWDIPKVQVTPETLARFSEVNPDGRTGLCRACAAALPA